MKYLYKSMGKIRVIWFSYCLKQTLYHPLFYDNLWRKASRWIGAVSANAAVPASIVLPLVWVIHEHPVSVVNGSFEVSESCVTGSGCVPDRVPDWELHTQFLYELQPLLTEMMRTLVTEENLRHDNTLTTLETRCRIPLYSHRKTKGRFTGATNVIKSFSSGHHMFRYLYIVMHFLWCGTYPVFLDDFLTAFVGHQLGLSLQLSSALFHGSWESVLLHIDF